MGSTAEQSPHARALVTYGRCSGGGGAILNQLLSTPTSSMMSGGRPADSNVWKGSTGSPSMRMSCFR
eukprot:scaffold209550_cov19-Tisochrysis_lutea.AAC.5